MSTLLIVLGAALGKAVYEVGKEVVAKPLMGPAAERFKAWVRRGYDAKVDDAKMSTAIETAVRATGLTDWQNWADYPLRAALDRLAGSGQDALRQQTIAAALAMMRDAPEEIPAELLKTLDVDERHRPSLARFLWVFRETLARAGEDYRVLIELAHQDAARQHLWTMASTVVQTPQGAALRVIPVSPEAREMESSYLDTLVKTELRYLPLEGRRMQSPGGGLKMRLENVYIALNTTERAGGMDQERDELLVAEEQERQEPRSALYKALDCRRLLLLGKPGSGKTTFVEHLALVLAGERHDPGTGWAKNLISHDAVWEGPAPLPVRVRLREFAANDECLPRDRDEFGRAKHLLAYVEKYLEDGRWNEHLPRHVVNLFYQGGALLLLDGLDEVAESQRRRQVAQAIGDLAERRCPNLWILATCRVAQYPLDASGCCTAEWALPEFHCATLADFDSQQIEDFADHWFGEVYGSSKDQQLRLEKAQELKAAIRDRLDLQEIAPRPILLSQMALIHDNDKLPDSRVDLYVKCTELLLWEWERIRAERAGRYGENADRFIRNLDVPGLLRSALQDALDDAIFAVHASQGDAAGGPADIPTSALVDQLTNLFQVAGLEEHTAKSKATYFVSEFLGKRNGLIVPAGEYSFQTPHRTFQEFVAARSLLRQMNFHWQVSELARENYDLWRDVAVLAVGLAGRNQISWRAVDAINRLCSQEFPQSEAEFSCLILAGEALVEAGRLTVRMVKEQGPDVVRRVEDFLKRAMCNDDLLGKRKKSRVPISTRYAAAETLDRLGWLPPDLNTWIKVETPAPIYVARYPVTNVQFALFQDAGGYENPAYWGGVDSDAWRWRVKDHNVKQRGTGPVLHPKFWNDPRLGKGRRGYPVVGVSWYEANAYCVWLTELLQRLRAGAELLAMQCNLVTRLPPEAAVVRLLAKDEWVAAAGGEEGDRYPWGQEQRWYGSRANTRESGIGGTSPVGMYPSGRSIAGIWDMSGNVWEWTGSWYDKGRRALRGGSWFVDRRKARVRGHSWGNPDYSYYGVGFRVCSSPAGSGC